ncbi:MAG TPA: hypothetical protein VH740_06965 [Vicinamibacterales bacterium]|jgi:hypothetical protein
MDHLEPLEPRAPSCSPSRLFLGLVILIVATGFLADRHEWSGFRLNLPIWPWILVLIGLAKMGEWRAGDRPYPSRAAIVLLFFGVWGLVNEYRMFGVSYDRTWPIALIGLGVFLVLRSLSPVANGPSADEQ